MFLPWLSRGNRCRTSIYYPSFLSCLHIWLCFFKLVFVWCWCFRHCFLLRLLRLFVHFFLSPFSLQRNERIMKWDAIVLVALLAVAIQAQGNYPWSTFNYRLFDYRWLMTGLVIFKYPPAEIIWARGTCRSLDYRLVHYRPSDCWLLHCSLSHC